MKGSFHDRRHGGHQYLHNRHGKAKESQQNDLLKRAIDSLVSATIDGQLVSWTNTYAGPGAAVATHMPAVLAAAPDIDAGGPTLESTVNTAVTAGNASGAFSSVPATGPSNVYSKVSGTSWARQAYYNAAAGTADGLIFLNHFGGTDGIPGTSAGGPA